MVGLAMLSISSLETERLFPSFFGKSKRNEALVEKLKRNAGKYGFKVDSAGN